MKRKEDALLRLQDLLSRVRVVSQVDVVLHCGRVNLLILGGYEQGSHSNQLHFGLFNLKEGKVPVDNVNGEVERFRQ